MQRAAVRLATTVAQSPSVAGHESLEAARLRLRSRFQQKFGTTTLKAASTTAPSPIMPAPTLSADGEASLVHLEAARNRLRERFHATWPDAVISDAPKTTGILLAQQQEQMQVDTLDHLEAARLRLRARYLARWPAATDAVETSAAEALTAPCLQAESQPTETSAGAKPWAALDDLQLGALLERAQMGEGQTPVMPMPVGAHA